MRTIIKAWFIALLTLSALASCQQNPHRMDMSSAVQGAKTKEDHEALAEHYEQAAKDAEAKVEEHKKLLDQYKRHSYLYGRQGDTFIEHCESLIGSYQKVVDANTAIAKMHRQMANNAK